jgi:hypothetical protein
MCYQVTKLAKKAEILARVKSNDSQGGVALIIESGALYTAFQVHLLLSPLFYIHAWKIADQSYPE